MLKPSDAYRLDKTVWSEADFEKMGWHDTRIHAVTFAPEDFEFVLDIDYIFAWVEPEGPSNGYTFWVSPATLVFKNVRDFKATFGDPLGLDIMEINRSVPPTTNAARVPEWAWSMDLLQGEITFVASGFSQHTRKLPVHIKAQSLSPEERGGISFARLDNLAEL